MFDIPTNEPGAPARAPIASLDNVLSLLGRIIAALLVAVGAMVGWFGADHLALAQPGNDLPELGGGLPTERIDTAETWRRFQMSYTQGDQQTDYWFDFDTWTIKTRVTNTSGIEEVEIAGDVGYRRSGGEGEWIPTSVDDTRNIARFVMAGVGPFILTDLVPPDALGFTTLELEGTSLGERVYEIAVDVETLRTLHPLAYERWSDTTRIVGESGGRFRVRVLDDGRVVRIEGDVSTVTWSESSGPIAFGSPLGVPVAPPVVTPPDAPPAQVAPADVPVAPNEPTVESPGG